MPAEPPLSRLNDHAIQYAIINRRVHIDGEAQLGRPMFVEQSADLFSQHGDARLKVLISGQQPIPLPDMQMLELSQIAGRITLAEPRPEVPGELIAVSSGDLIDRKTPGTSEDGPQFEASIPSQLVRDFERDETGSRERETKLAVTTNDFVLEDGLGASLTNSKKKRH